MDVFSALTAVAVALISFVSFGQMEVDWSSIGGAVVAHFALQENLASLNHFQFFSNKIPTESVVLKMWRVSGVLCTLLIQSFELMCD